METFESVLKRGLLYVFSLLNAIDLVQTMSFLRLGIESNPFVVYYPYLWFPLKFLLAFGLPVGLYQLDVYLEKKEDEGTYNLLKSLVALGYLLILLGDIFYFQIVLRNSRILGGLF